MKDYFALLNLTPSFDLDLAALETAYFAAQRQAHPDRFVGRPPAERASAMQRSVDINNAYQALKDPLARAKYLLSLQGMKVGTEQDDIKPTSDLLAEAMEWRERVEEAQTGDELHRVDHRLGQLHGNIIEDIAAAYAQKDWQSMAKSVHRLSYLIKTREELTLQRIRMQKEQAS